MAVVLQSDQRIPEKIAKPILAQALLTRVNKFQYSNLLTRLEAQPIIPGMRGAFTPITDPGHLVRPCRQPHGVWRETSVSHGNRPWWTGLDINSFRGAKRFGSTTIGLRILRWVHSAGGYARGAAGSPRSGCIVATNRFSPLRCSFIRTCI